MAVAFAFPAAAETFKLAVTDIEGLEALEQGFGAFSNAQQEVTGHDIELYPVSSRTAAVEAIDQKQVNFVLTGPAEYVVVKELLKVEIVGIGQELKVAFDLFQYRNASTIIFVSFFIVLVMEWTTDRLRRMSQLDNSSKSVVIEVSTVNDQRYHGAAIDSSRVCHEFFTQCKACLME